MRKVLLVDDYEGVLSLVHATLRNDERYQILLARDGEEALDIARLEKPDLIFMDIMMPKTDGEEALAKLQNTMADVVLLDVKLGGIDGIETLRQMKLSYPDLKVIMLTSYGDEYLSPSIEAGATGYLLKRANRAQMVEAIHEAVDGGAPLDPLVTPGLLYRLRNLSGHEGAKLSARETQVLELVAAGLSNKEIASQLTVMQSTVKNHMTSILQKLDANDRTHAVTIALRKDWISNPIPIDHKAPHST